MSIETINLTHVYMAGTARAIRAVDAISLRVEDGESVGIMGPTGSGKSTLVQHFNGLLKPTEGRVVVDGEDLWPGPEPGDRRRRHDLRPVRQKVGLIFQFPEHQLFEETVFDDVAFGPRNLGLSQAEVKERVREALESVGLGGTEGQVLQGRSPFSLSGGQMRRVAIAGVLAMKPGTLVLDEPTAGLDPRGKRDLLESLARLQLERGLTLIIVSHNMEDLARLARRVVVLDHGRVVEDDEARTIFNRPDRLRELGLEAPPVITLMHSLAGRGAPVRTGLLKATEAADEIHRWLATRSQGGD